MRQNDAAHKKEIVKHLLLGLLLHAVQHLTRTETLSSLSLASSSRQ